MDFINSKKASQEVSGCAAVNTDHGTFWESHHTHLTFVFISALHHKIEPGLLSNCPLDKLQLSMGMYTKPIAAHTSHVSSRSQQLVIMRVSVSFVSPPCTKESKAARRASKQQTPATQCQRARPSLPTPRACCSRSPWLSQLLGWWGGSTTTAQTNSLSHQLAERHLTQKDRQHTTCSRRDAHTEWTGDLWPLRSHTFVLRGIRGLWYEVELAGEGWIASVCVVFLEIRDLWGKTSLPDQSAGFICWCGLKSRNGVLLDRRTIL